MTFDPQYSSLGGTVEGLKHGQGQTGLFFQPHPWTDACFVCSKLDLRKGHLGLGVRRRNLGLPSPGWPCQEEGKWSAVSDSPNLLERTTIGKYPLDIGTRHSLALIDAVREPEYRDGDRRLLFQEGCFIEAMCFTMLLFCSVWLGLVWFGVVWYGLA